MGGLLNDDLELFQKEYGYDGQASYMSAQVVVESGFITANETAAVDFAHAIFHILKIDTNKEIDL